MKIWVTWEIQRRNRSMADAIGAELHEIIVNGNSLKRYVVSIIKTTRLVKKKRPDVIFYQNPSIVLSLLIVCIKLISLRKYKIVGDFHNAGLLPPLGAIGRSLSYWVIKNSDIIILTNKNLIQAAPNLIERTIIYPDPLPSIPDGEVTPVANPNSSFDILFICSWAEDEPIENVIAAFSKAGAQIEASTLTISGRPKKDRIPSGTSSADNIIFSGFVSNEAFEKLLFSSSAIIDLTTREDCMVCGAYEAIAAEKPSILSDNVATKEYFRAGALFTDNSVDNLADRIIELHRNYEALYRQAISLKNELREQDIKHKEQLDSAIERL